MKQFSVVLIVMLLAIMFVSSAFPMEIKTQTIDKLGIDPNIEFLSSGPFFDKQYTHFRVIVSAMEIYSAVILEKVIPETEGQEGKVLWTRIMKFDEDTIFIAPKDFVESFKWVSPTSFTFKNFGKKYLLEGIDKETTVLKELDKTGK